MRINLNTFLSLRLFHMIISAPIRGDKLSYRFRVASDEKTLCWNFWEWREEEHQEFIRIRVVNLNVCGKGQKVRSF